jgi:hypothetical protein
MREQPKLHDTCGYHRAAAQASHVAKGNRGECVMSEDSEQFCRDLSRSGFKKRRGDDVWECEIIGKLTIMRQSEHYFTVGFKVRRSPDEQVITNGDAMSNIVFVSAPISKFSKLPAAERRRED